MLGVTLIKGVEKKHTGNDFGLKWTDVTIEAPEPKTYKIDIPFRDGSLDLTNSLSGDVKYKNRKIKLNFETDGDYYTWQEFYSKISNFVHGESVKIILDTDTTYFWRGRLTLTSTKQDYAYGSVEMQLDAEPYKLEANTGDDWIWDTFNFNTGIIRKRKYVVNGSLNISVKGTRHHAPLTITTNNPIQVIYNNKTYQLQKGQSEILDIIIREEDLTFTVKGDATISVDYEGGSL